MIDRRPVAALLVIGAIAASSLSTPVAAACVSLGPIDNSETIDFGTDLNVLIPGTQSCAVTTTLVVPAGHYGVFKADSRGFVGLLDPAHAASLSLTGPGAATGQTEATFSGPFIDNTSFTGYYATGLVGVDTPFNGTATAEGTGPNDGSEVNYDGVDFLLAFTTLGEQEDSLDIVGLQQLSLVTHLGGVADLLTGGNLTLEGSNEVGLIGGKGSYAIGAAGRYNLADGVSVLGGVSLVDLGSAGASASGVMAAAALRYVEPGVNTFRLVGEAGIDASLLQLSFSRTYANGFNTTAASGAGSGGSGAIYVRGGVLWQPTPENEVLFSAKLKQGALGIGSLIEGDSLTDPNFFAATYSGQSTQTTMVKAGVDWTSQLSPEVDVTTSLALGASFNGGASASIFGIPGTVTGAPQSTLYAQYGVRLGWRPTENTVVDGFVHGTTGTGIGTHALIGAGARMQF